MTDEAKVPQPQAEALRRIGLELGVLEVAPSAIDQTALYEILTRLFSVVWKVADVSPPAGSEARGDQTDMWANYPQSDIGTLISRYDPKYDTDYFPPSLDESIVPVPSPLAQDFYDSLDAALAENRMPAVLTDMGADDFANLLATQRRSFEDVEREEAGERFDAEQARQNECRWVEGMLVPVGVPMGELIEPDDEVVIEGLVLHGAPHSATGLFGSVYPQRPPRQTDSTDHLVFEGVVPDPDPEVERMAKLASATPGVDRWRDLLRGSGEEDEHYYESQDQGR